MLKPSERRLLLRLLNLARDSRQRSDFATAITYYQKALKHQPRRVDIYAELGNTYNLQQQSYLAIEAYQRAISLQADQPAWVYQGLAKAFHRQQQYPDAIAAWQRAIELDSQPPDWVYQGLGNSLSRQGKSTKAIAAYQQAIKINPQSPAWLYRKLGDALVKQEEWNQAISAYQQAIIINPTFASMTQNKIGDILNQQNKFFAAKAAYREAHIARSVCNVNEVITFICQSFPQENGGFQLDILDNGCESTGQQLALLAEQTQGRVVGTNICPGFPEQTLKVRHPHNEFYQMDGQNLTFANSSFDLVISLNVLEHVPNPVKYLQECYRVLRPGGFGFFSWYPLWSGATGHHIHPDMVRQKAQNLGLTPPHYSLDDTSIPHWGHLLFSHSQMLSFLLAEKNYHPALAEWMSHYIYHHCDLNRWFWRDFRRTFQNLPWNAIELKRRRNWAMDAVTLKQLEQKYGTIEDFQVCGAQIIVQK